MDSSSHGGYPLWIRTYYILCYMLDANELSKIWRKCYEAPYSLQRTNETSAQKWLCRSVHVVKFRRFLIQVLGRDGVHSFYFSTIITIWNSIQNFSVIIPFNFSSLKLGPFFWIQKLASRFSLKELDHMAKQIVKVKELTDDDQTDGIKITYTMIFVMVNCLESAMQWENLHSVVVQRSL